MTKEELQKVADLPRADRINTVNMLLASGQMTGNEYYNDFRPLVEAKRGIVRDATGNIVRSKDWKKKRIEHLEFKVVDLQRNINNAQSEIKELKKTLK